MRKVLHTLIIALAFATITDFSATAQRNGGRQGSERHNVGNRKESTRPNSGSHGVNRVSFDNHKSSGTSGRPGIGANNGNRPGVSSTPANNRPNNGNNRPNVGTNRPNNVGTSRPNTGTSGRPGIGSNNGNNKPGVGNNKPGNNRPGVGNNRPGVGNNRPGIGNNRPGIGNNRPGIGNNRPGNQPPAVGRPGVNHAHRPAVLVPPHRPYRPVIARPMHRPVPPPAWRPRRGLPLIRGILGLTFGAAIGVSLDYLYNSGYTVDGYDNNVVYLRNVPALNYIWTDGALYYGNNGLDASTFYYTTPGYDLARYNAVYATLLNTYGQPVTVNNTVGSLSATWFGGNNGYVTLSFGAGTAGRFLTSLTFGM